MLDIEKLKKKYNENETNKIKKRLLNKVPLIDLVTDTDTQIESEFNIEIKTHKVTDQKASGRCWAFAGLNILREKVIEKLNLDSFELSGSYIAFYDKLERFNQLLERLISYKKEKKNVYDRYVSELLENGMADGGNFTHFSNIINKYGIVPISIFPETFTSSNTYEINQILSRLLRKFYLDLEECSGKGDNIKNKYLEYAFTVIGNTYGIPLERFNFEYTDKKGKYHIDKNITPKEFYDKYIGIDLINDYIEVTTYRDEKYKYNSLYEVAESSKINGLNDLKYLNVSNNDFQKLIIKQLKSKEPVCFSCSTTSKRVDGIWIDLIERYGDIFDIDLTMDRNEILRTNGITNAHSMLITGVNIVDNKTTKWKIENSWGSKYGNQGYYIATDDWVNKYIFRVVINKKYLNKKQHSILEQKPIIINKWDEKF